MQPCSPVGIKTVSSGFGNPKLGQLLVLAEVILHPSHISFALCSFTFISPWKLPSFCQSLQSLLRVAFWSGKRGRDGDLRMGRPDKAGGFVLSMCHSWAKMHGFLLGVALARHKDRRLFCSGSRTGASKKVHVARARWVAVMMLVWSVVCPHMN